MIKIKKIVQIVFFSIIIMQKGYAGISDSLFMTIGNKAITKSDVVDEIKIILILNNQSYSEDKRDELHNAAVNSIIQRTVKKIEIEKRDFLEFSPRDYESELIRISSKMNVDIDIMKNIFASNNLDFTLVETQIKTELLWNSLIFQLYKNRLSVNAEEIDEKLKLIQEEKNLKEYLVSEILLKPIEDQNFDTQINKIMNKIQTEGFGIAAKSFSVSSSGSNGGDLGWIHENSIAEKVKTLIVETGVGKVSKPLVLVNGVLIFKVREERIVNANITLEDRKNQLVNYEKQKILNIHGLSHYDQIKRSVSINILK
jgi:peptidyl-prolyl cis-trans isomerase SurA